MSLIIKIKCDSSLGTLLVQIEYYHGKYTVISL